MFLQLVTPPSPGPLVQQNVDSLFIYHPLQISAIVETVWRNRYNAASTPFVPWPQAFTDALLAAPPYTQGWTFPNSGPPLSIPQADGLMPSGETFVAPFDQPGISLTGSQVQPTNWDHIIYAYTIENTRIFDVFAKVLETYIFSERLETPSPASQQFWRNTEYLIYGDGLPTMLWAPTSRLRRDEIASRLTTYYRMIGADLSHAQELAAQHPYEKPAAANRDFIPTFEAFAREVWRGIVNARNTSGQNDTDAAVIATLARRIFDMMATRQQSGNLAREAFRAVGIISWLHLAVMYDSPAVVDLKATASSPEQRLAKIAERVDMKINPSSKMLFDLAQPFSILMQSIETGAFNTPQGAKLLYTLQPPNVVEPNVEVVIDQYALATGRDLKAQAVAVTERVQTATRLPAPKVPAHVAHRANGHASPSRGALPGGAGGA
jgi:hypothetical protein